MSVKFTDSIDGNLDLLRELLRGAPPDARKRAANAAGAIEGLVVKIQKDSPKDPAIALGTVFGLLMIAQRIVESKGGAETGGDAPLIQLLS